MKAKIFRACCVLFVMLVMFAVTSLELSARTLGMVADNETDSVTVFDADTHAVLGTVPVISTLVVSAFVTDVLLRAFKHSSGFTSSLYEFVSHCQEFSLVPLKELANNALRRALETI